MSDEIKMPHDYLEALLNLKRALYSPGEARHMFEDTPEQKVVNRLIAAAEADAPELPEGWVLLRYFGGPSGVWHYPGHGDYLTRYDDGSGDRIGILDQDRDRLTPLRPTVTEADLQRAVTAFYGSGMEVYGALRTAFEAAGIEVSDQ